MWPWGQFFLRFVDTESYFILGVLLKKLNNNNKKNIIVDNVTKTHDPVKKVLGLLSVSWGGTVR